MTKDGVELTELNDVVDGNNWEEVSLKLTNEDSKDVGKNPTMLHIGLPDLAIADSADFLVAALDPNEAQATRTMDYWEKRETAKKATKTINDIVYGPHFSNTNLINYSVVNRSLTSAFESHQPVCAVRYDSEAGALWAGLYLVAEYNPNFARPAEGTITLMERDLLTPYGTSRPPLGIEDLGDGKIRMNLQAFSQYFQSLELAISDPKTGFDQNGFRKAVASVMSGEHTTHTNSFTRYSTMDRELTLAFEEHRPVVAYLSHLWSTKPLSRGSYLVTSFEPNPAMPNQATITLMRPQSPYQGDTPEGVNDLGNGQLRMSLQTFNKFFQSLNYAKERTSR